MRPPTIGRAPRRQMQQGCTRRQRRAEPRPGARRMAADGRHKPRKPGGRTATRAPPSGEGVPSLPSWFSGSGSARCATRSGRRRAAPHHAARQLAAAIRKTTNARPDGNQRGLPRGARAFRSASTSRPGSSAMISARSARCSFSLDAPASEPGADRRASIARGSAPSWRKKEENTIVFLLTFLIVSDII